ncbi:hypothetical protein FRC03_001056 [Tulasnella sp. 419]|nr:hypothetical protein FRC03_001056 [Tulasnella sp. 419]
MSDPVLLAQQLNRLEQLLRSLPKSLPECHAATPASAKDINEMTQAKPTDHKDCTSPQDEEFDSCFTFSIEYVVKLDHKYLLTLYSGGQTQSSGSMQMVPATMTSISDEDEQDNDIWDQNNAWNSNDLV